MTDQILTTQRTGGRAQSGASPVAGPDLSSLFLRAATTLARLLRRRRDRAHLSELPDYLLEDIGLTRADVPGKPPAGEGWR